MDDQKKDYSDSEPCLQKKKKKKKEKKKEEKHL